MKTTDFINTNAILWMEVVSSRDSHIIWQNSIPEIKGWFGIKQYARAEGWVAYNSLISEEEILKDERLYIDRENRKVMKKPYAKIVIQSGKYPAESYQYFDTVEEANIWATEIAQKIPLIKVNHIG